MEAFEKEKGKIPGVLIFGGTTESLAILDDLQDFDLDVTLSVATEYGRECAGKRKGVKIISGRMDREEILLYIREHSVDLVIDATHPFALEVTENIRWACEQIPVEYIRCLRDEIKLQDEMRGQDCTDAQTELQVVYVASVSEAAAYLSSTKGNILITTGSKELSKFCEIPDYRTRCYARVLSVPESVKSGAECGFIGRNLIAMHPPYSKEMNIAVIHYADAAFFVTKETGKAGGMREKMQACSETGTTLVVIRRPGEAGSSVRELRMELDQRFQKYKQTV